MVSVALSAITSEAVRVRFFFAVTLNTPVHPVGALQTLPLYCFTESAMVQPKSLGAFVCVVDAVVSQL